MRVLRLGGIIVAFVAQATLPATAAPLPSWLSFTAISEAHLERLERVRIDEPRATELANQGYGIALAGLMREVHLSRDGWVVDRSYEVRQYLSEQGVHADGDLYFGLRPSVDTGAIETAVAILPDGTRRPVSSETVQIVNSPRMPVFTDERIIVLPIQGLSSGSRAILVTRRRFRTDAIPYPWSAQMWPQWRAPIEHFEFTVTWDAGVDAPVLETADKELRCEREERRWHCRREHVAALKQPVGDPPLEDELLHAVAAMPNTWRSLGETVGRVFEKKIAASGDLGPKARKLVGDADTVDGQIEALHRFVADRIRYVALMEGERAVVPNPPSVTMERGFGDCKDKSTLFVGLARALGLRAYPVLVATDRKRVDGMLLPAASYFDHLIACVDIVDREPVCLDPTVAFSPPGVLPSGIQGAAALRLDGQADGLMNLPTDPYAWKVRIDSTAEIGCGRDNPAKTRWEIGGPAALAMRAGLGPRTQEERQTSVRAWLRNAMREQEYTLRLDGLDDASEALVIEIDERTADAKRFEGLKIYSDWDPSLTTTVAVLLEEGDPPYGTWSEGMKITSRWRFAKCEGGSVVGDGPALDYRAPYGSFTRRYTDIDGETIVETALEIPRRRIEVGEHEKFRRFLRTLLNESGLRVTIKPK